MRERKKFKLVMKQEKIQTWIWRQEKKSNLDMKARKKSNLDLKARKNQTWMWRQASLGSREVIFLGRGTLSTWEHDYHDIIYVRWWSVVGWSNIMMAMLLIGRVTLAICEDNKVATLLSMYLWSWEMVILLTSWHIVDRLWSWWMVLVIFVIIVGHD